MSSIRQMLKKNKYYKKLTYVVRSNRPLMNGVSNFVLAVIFFLVLTPVALIKRSFYKTILTRFDKTDKSSRWRVREQSTQQKEIYRSKL